MFETPQVRSAWETSKTSKNTSFAFHYSHVINNATSQRASIKNTTAERMDCTTSTSSTKKYSTVFFVHHYIN